MLKLPRTEVQRQVKAASILRRPTRPLDFPTIEWPASRPPADGSAAAPAGAQGPLPSDAEAPVDVGAVLRQKLAPPPNDVAPPSIDVMRQRRPVTAADRTLQPHSIRWILALPRRHRPRHLALQFPHVINRLALAWSDPALVQACFTDLVVDRRGGRIGFPRAVTEEILKLHELFLALQDSRYRPATPLEADGAGDTAWRTTIRDRLP